MTPRGRWIAVAAAALAGLAWFGLDMGNTPEPPLPPAATAADGPRWRRDFTHVADLAASPARLTAAVTVGGAPILLGLDEDGGTAWQRQTNTDAMLIPGSTSILAAAGGELMRIDAADGTVMASRAVEPPPGGWNKATARPIGDDFLITTAAGLARLGGTELVTRWLVPLPLDGDADVIRQIVHDPPWIAAVSTRLIAVMSESGELAWTRKLEADTRVVGSTPLVLSGGRLWLAVAPASNPGGRVLQEWSVGTGAPRAAVAIDDLAMDCPAHVTGTLLVLNTQSGHAAFDTADALRRVWSVDVPVALGACATMNGEIFAASRTGTLFRVGLHDGSVETLYALPRKQRWVPPAPDLEPGSYETSEGAIEQVAVTAHGTAFSVAWSNERASIMFLPF